MSETAVQVPITMIISMLTTIANRDWQQFKQMEADFVHQYGVDVWQEVFNFRLKPALDKDSDRWLLIQLCSTDIKSVPKIDLPVWETEREFIEKIKTRPAQSGGRDWQREDLHER